jgi:hypothetical protein
MIPVKAKIPRLAERRMSIATLVAGVIVAASLAALPFFGTDEGLVPPSGQRSSTSLPPNGSVILRTHKSNGEITRETTPSAPRPEQKKNRPGVSWSTETFEKVVVAQYASGSWAVDAFEKPPRKITTRPGTNVYSWSIGIFYEL